MATTTTNLGLIKPGTGDFIDVQNFNDNFDKLDKAVLKDGTVAFDNLTVGSRAANSVKGTNSVAEGINVTASGAYSHAEGNLTIASGSYSHGEGYQTTASGNYSHVEGYQNTASASTAHAEGTLAIASGPQSHAEGYGTVAGSTGTATTSSDATTGYYTHSEGNGTKATGNSAHSEGKGTLSSAIGSHAEGLYSTASGNGSHAEGGTTTASGSYSHSEGSGTVAGSTGTATSSSDTTAGYFSHAEGNGTKASGNSSHAEGKQTVASAIASHAEGALTTASGAYSHAEGNTATASGSYSHAGGLGTVAAGEAQTAIGKFNVSDTTSLFKVGMGTADAARADALALDTSGNLVTAGNMAAVIPTAGGTATAITLGFAPLVNGASLSFIAAANNSGAATTINTKPLYKPGTTTAPTLVAGKAYTVWYSTSGGCFFIKASAEGTATADKVLAGFTFSNDNDTGITGTLAPSGIKSIQSGDASITAGYQILQTTISAVDTSNSVVIIQNAGNETQTSVQHLCVLGELINSTTLSLVRVGTSGEAKVTWTVIEFENLKSFQTGTLQTTGGPGSFQTAPITTVVPGKTMVFASFKTVDTGNFATLGAGAIRARLWDASRVAVAREVGGFGTVTVRWYVVEFK